MEHASDPVRYSWPRHVGKVAHGSDHETFFFSAASATKGGCAGLTTLEGCTCCCLETFGRPSVSLNRRRTATTSWWASERPHWIFGKRLLREGTPRFPRGVAVA
ncbi:hypothetical protein V5799_024466 [Amblyomma americanum]|uniref:Uncharacterized protein n=1 Tax=Amblyomma americanum TaxID=6943 RepID=A0AAQ4EBZ4_AMBAM